MQSIKLTDSELSLLHKIRNYNKW